MEIAAKPIEAALGIAKETYEGSTLPRAKSRADNGVIKGEEEAHHIVARTDARAAESRAILESHGIGSNSAENGAAMKTCEHRCVHTNDYHAGITERLKAADQAGGRQGVINQLNAERRTLEGK